MRKEVDQHIYKKESTLRSLQGNKAARYIFYKKKAPLQFSCKGAYQRRYVKSHIHVTLYYVLSYTIQLRVLQLHRRLFLSIL